jgi:hypothetical protein
MSDEKAKQQLYGKKRGKLEVMMMDIKIRH